MRYITKTGGSPEGLPKIYFACHPEDHPVYFDALCRDLFRQLPCAVYYGEELSVPTPEEELLLCNLTVVPVTFRLLSSPSPAMDTELPLLFSQERPVLPVLMEPALVQDFNSSPLFHGRQYLDATQQDNTKLSYEQKLKSFLSTTLITPELIRQIRVAFAAYIFLSYRKPDRELANRLRQQIHSLPQYRDIAIWYDEYLTPGESFRKNIEKNLRKSKLFALLVTPNILERPEGRQNFVMGTEYPSALRLGLPVLPVEMVPTDRQQLDGEFPALPPCADPEDREAFTQRLLDALTDLALAESPTDPAHNYLIGRAYLDGVDVETDRQRGLSLIRGAAEDRLPDAMEYLFDACSQGLFPDLPRQEAQLWGRRLVDYYEEQQGPAGADTLRMKNDLALEYEDQDLYPEAKALLEEVCQLLRQAGDPHVTEVQVNLADVYGKLGEPHKELELLEAARAALPETPETLQDPDAIGLLNRVAVARRNLGRYREALALQEDIYQRCRSAMGPKDPRTVTVMHELADTLALLDDTDRLLALEQEAYEICCENMPELLPERLQAKLRLAYTFARVNQPEKALALLDEVERDRRRLALPDAHPLSRAVLSCRRELLRQQDQLEEAIALGMDLYLTLCDGLGSRHLLTLEALVALGQDQSNAHSPEGLVTLERAVTLYREHYPSWHRDALSASMALAAACRESGDYQRMLELYRQCHQVSLQKYGPAYDLTISALAGYAAALQENGQTQQAVKLLRKALQQFTELVGPDHRNVEDYRQELLQALRRNGQYQEALEGCQALLEKKTARLEPDHPEVIRLRNLLGAILLDLEQPEDALLQFRRAYDQAVSRLPLSSDIRRSVTISLAAAHGAKNRHGRELRLHREALKGLQQLYGPHHPEVLAQQANIAVTIAGAGQLEEGLQQLSDLLEGPCKQLPRAHHSRLSILENMAGIHFLAEHYHKACALRRQIYTLYTEALQASHPFRLEAMEQYLISHTHLPHEKEVWLSMDLQQRLALMRQALPVARELYALRQQLPATHPKGLLALDLLARTQMNGGYFREAQKNFEQLLALQLQVYSRFHPDICATEAHLKELLVYLSSGGKK